jgi:hypothetical protein
LVQTGGLNHDRIEIPVSSGGIQVVQGAGTESAFQPLSRFAALTATRDILPTAGVGGGLKYSLQKHLRLRIEVRDYISGAPVCGHCPRARRPNERSRQ